MKIEDKIYEIFNERLRDLEKRFVDGSKPRWNYMSSLVEEWKECLERIKGLKRSGRLMALLIDRHDGYVRFDDPLGDGCVIDLPFDTATKILTLGYLP